MWYGNGYMVRVILLYYSGRAVHSNHWSLSGGMILVWWNCCSAALSLALAPLTIPLSVVPLRGGVSQYIIMIITPLLACSLRVLAGAKEPENRISESPVNWPHSESHS